MSNFRLMLKPSVKAWKPDESQFAVRRPAKAPPQPDVGSSSKLPKKEVRRCHAFLEAFNPAPKKLSSHSDVGNYAVIGRGFAATVNLSTLRSEWGRTRVHRGGKGRHLMLVGFADPWATYVRHNMNQEVELLTLPGYENRPALPDWSKAPRWLDSRDFAATNAAELRRHTDEANREVGSRESFFRQHHQIAAGVTHIERVASKRTGKLKRFRLHLNDAEGTQLIASKVDICTGVGPQTLVPDTKEDLKRGVKMSAALWQEYLSPEMRNPRPRVWSAEMYVAGDRQFKAGGSVLITSAASPAGIQAGEHALCLDTAGLGFGGPAAAEVVLMASEKINSGFPPIGRLDALARTREGDANGALPMRLKTDDNIDLYPTHPRLWFGEGYRAVSVEELTPQHLEAFCRVAEDGLAPGADLTELDIAEGRLLVTFAPGARLVRGASEGPVNADEAPLLYGLFDQVVFNTGRNRGGRTVGKPEDEVGSAMQMVSGFWGNLAAIKLPDYDFPVGLQTNDDDGRLRILGAAGINNPIYKQAAETDFERYEDSIPWQGRVAGEGVTLAAVTIAIANRFFRNNTTDCNPCVNTATRSELEKVLKDAEAARTIHAMRHWRVRPLMRLDEILSASQYWKCFFSEPDLNSLLEERARRGDPAFDSSITNIRYMIGAINDAGYLGQDGAWPKNKKRLETLELLPLDAPPPFDVQLLTRVLVRYADHIADPDKRVKIRTADPGVRL